MTALWGDELAASVVRGLARHGARAVPLASLEPDLDPAVHHTNMPIAIVIQHVVGPIAWFHVAAVIEGRQVVVDGPTADARGTIDVKTPADVDRAISRLDSVATSWLGTRHEQLGVTDATLAVMVLLRRRGNGAWGMYINGSPRKVEGYIAARRDGKRWPVSIALDSATDGVRIQCGPSDRVIRTLAELDFDVREAPIVEAQLAWCTRFIAEVRELATVASAILAHLRRRMPARAWSLSTPESHFAQQDTPKVTISVSELAGAIELTRGADDGVHMSCTSGPQRLFANVGAFEAVHEAVTAAIAAAVDTWQPPAPWQPTDINDR